MSFRLIHLTDPHFGTADPQQAERLISLSHDLAPDFLLISGDFSMRARMHELKAARAWLARLPTPNMTLPGNHDTPLFNHLGHRFFHPFKRYQQFISEELEPHADLPIGRLQGLNSSIPFGTHLNWSRGFLRQAQRDGLVARFDGVNGLRLLSFHHPLLRREGSKRRLIEPREKIISAILAAEVDIVFSGHFHQAIVDTIETQDSSRNFLVCQSSTACSTRLKQEPAGFHCVDLDSGPGTRARFTQFQWQGNDYQAISERVFAKSSNTWAELL